MSLSDRELLLIQDRDFLLAKVEVLSKINVLLGDTRSSLQDYLGSTDFVFPVDVNLSDGKISKGEYYLHLPYFVLDFPAMFTLEDVFAFRTMFWWGNFFSSTLHLQGAHLDEHRMQLSNNIPSLLDKQVYISQGDAPWAYHYEEDNYIPINAEHAEHIQSCKFLKLSRKIDLSKSKSLPKFAAETLNLFLSVL